MTEPTSPPDDSAALVGRIKATFHKINREAEEKKRIERRDRAESFLRGGGFRARDQADRELLRRSEAAAPVFDVVVSNRPALEDLVDQVADAFRRMEKNPGAPVLWRSGRHPPLVLDLTGEEVIAVVDEVDDRRTAEGGSWPHPDPVVMQCNEIRVRLLRGELGLTEGQQRTRDLVMMFTDPDRVIGRGRRKQQQAIAERNRGRAKEPKDPGTARRILTLHAQGKSYQQIATALHTGKPDLVKGIVRRWILEADGTFTPRPKKARRSSS